MKRRELLRRLQKEGCVLLRSGSNHDINRGMGHDRELVGRYEGKFYRNRVVAFDVLGAIGFPNSLNHCPLSSLPHSIFRHGIESCYFHRLIACSARRHNDNDEDNIHWDFGPGHIDVRPRTDHVIRSWSRNDLVPNDCRITGIWCFQPSAYLAHYGCGACHTGPWRSIHGTPTRHRGYGMDFASGV